MAELKVKKHTTYTYETSDGKEFYDENEATEWQKHLCNLEGVRLLDYKFNPTKDINNASYIYAKTVEQAEAFNAMQEDFGFISKLGSSGFFRYDEIADAFIDIEAEITELQNIIDILQAKGESE